jgi:Domain of unknown function (DUF3560)
MWIRTTLDFFNSTLFHFSTTHFLTRSKEKIMTTFTATYSPEANKLRLYASRRLDDDLYQQARELGFIWAPKQDLFVAPMWTPSREKFLLDLCGEIEDEDKSLVERAEERADRFGDYSQSRTKDAIAAHNAVDAIASNIPFGQPILVGHHSERRARKDAERIHNGMRKAVQMWDTAGYWTQRAAGALRAAKYKERADVRARRIKRIEADKRKQEKNKEQAERMLTFWSQENLTYAQAIEIAASDRVYACFSLEEFPRELPASQYQGQMSIWSALNDGIIDEKKAQELCSKAHSRSIEWANKWISHYENRLIYENAMLQEQGGTAADKWNLEVGGKAKIGGEWFLIKRVNKKHNKALSVSINRRFVPVVGLEDIQDYLAPTAEDTAKVQQQTTLAPLVNYPGEGFVHITKKVWATCHSDYKGTARIAETENIGVHRVRRMSAGSAGAYTVGGYPYVFITDQKRIDPPNKEMNAHETASDAVELMLF